MKNITDDVPVPNFLLLHCGVKLSANMGGAKLSTVLNCPRTIITKSCSEICSKEMSKIWRQMGFQYFSWVWLSTSPLLVCDIYLDYFMQISQGLPALGQEYSSLAHFLFSDHWINIDLWICLELFVYRYIYIFLEYYIYIYIDKHRYINIYLYYKSEPCVTILNFSGNIEVSWSDWHSIEQARRSWGKAGLLMLQYISFGFHDWIMDNISCN